MIALTNSENPDDMRHGALSLWSALVAKTKSNFREINALFVWKLLPVVTQ